MTNESPVKFTLHEPAPWVFKKDASTRHEHVVSHPHSGGDRLVAIIPIGHHETAIANANLIATAPELYEALAAYVANDENQSLDDDEMYQSAVAALAKARGEA